MGLTVLAWLRRLRAEPVPLSLGCVPSSYSELGELCVRGSCRTRRHVPDTASPCASRPRALPFLGARGGSSPHTRLAPVVRRTAGARLPALPDLADGRH